MPITVRFSNEVRDWIAQNLAHSCKPDDIVRQLLELRVEPELAQAMVQAVEQALSGNTPMPQGTLTLGASEPDYAPQPSRLASGPVIIAGERPVRVLIKMQRPCIALLDNVLDTEECDALIHQARPRLSASTLVDPVSGNDMVTTERSSEGMFFRLKETPLVQRLDQRIAELMGQPVEHGEGIQVLHYPVGAQCAPHFDFLMTTNTANLDSVARSGQRISTLIIYLNDVIAGGETLFPHLGLSVVPRRGQALYFEYTNGLGQTDPLSLHAAAPVQVGEKWIATKWMRERRFLSASASVRTQSA